MRRPLLILVVATAVQTLGAIVYQTLGVISPFLIASLDLSVVELGILPSAMHAGSLVALAIGASLIDRVGAPRLLGVGAIASSAALLLAAATGSYAILIACLAGVGAAWGLSAIAGGEAIILAAPVGRRATITSIRQLALPVGGLIAAATAPAVTIGGWQGLLIGQAVAYLLIGAYIMRTRSLPSHEPRRTAWLQIPTLRGAAVGALAIGLTATQAAFLVYAVLELTTRVGMGFESAAALYLLSQAAGAAFRVGLGVISDAVPLSRAGLLAINTLAAAGMAFAFGQLAPDTPAWLTVGTVLLASAFIIGWNGVLVVALLESGASGDVNRNLGAGMTLMRIGIILGPPLFGLTLTTLGSAMAWNLVAVLMAVLAAGFVLLGSGRHERQSLERAGHVGAG